MAECFDQVFSTRDVESSREVESYVILRLYNPKYEHQPLSYSHLIKLKLEYCQLKRFSIQFATQQIQEQLYLLYFESVEDALDFKEETKHLLHYSLALFRTEDQYRLQNYAIGYYKSDKLQKQMGQQGFELRNGCIKLKKITSVEDVLAKYEDSFQQQQESTLVHTKRKISFDSSVMQKEQNAQEESQQDDQSQQNKNTILERVGQVFDCAMIAGLLYGGFQLFRYLNKI